jgi:hypothetical protein
LLAFWCKMWYDSPPGSLHGASPLAIRDPLIYQFLQ